MEDNLGMKKNEKAEKQNHIKKIMILIHYSLF